MFVIAHKYQCLQRRSLPHPSGRTTHRLISRGQSLLLLKILRNRSPCRPPGTVCFMTSSFSSGRYYRCSEGRRCIGTPRVDYLVTFTLLRRRLDISSGNDNGLLGHTLQLVPPAGFATVLLSVVHFYQPHRLRHSSLPATKLSARRSSSSFFARCLPDFRALSRRASKSDVHVGIEALPSRKLLKILRDARPCLRWFFVDHAVMGDPYCSQYCHRF